MTEQQGAEDALHHLRSRINLLRTDLRGAIVECDDPQGRALIADADPTT